MLANHLTEPFLTQVTKVFLWSSVFKKTFREQNVGQNILSKAVVIRALGKLTELPRIHSLMNLGPDSPLLHTFWSHLSKLSIKSHQIRTAF